MIGLIFLLLMVIFVVSVDKQEEDLAISVGFAGAFMLVIVIVMSAILFHGTKVLPKKIEMYQEENTRIEQKIANTVEKYMQYEKEIMIEVSPEDDVITLIALYPELKADELVKEEMNVYIENSKKIKEMKADVLRAPLYKFLLFFGH